MGLKKKIRYAISALPQISRHRREINLSPRVLFYHGVSDIHNPFVESLHISPAAFSRQMDYLQRYYEIISMDEFYARWADWSFSGREAVLTFDDGYENNLRVAAPILVRRGLPFTVFVSTDNITSGARFATFIVRAVIADRALKVLEVPSLGVSKRLYSHDERITVAKHVNRRLKTLPLDEVQRVVSQITDNLSPQEYERLLNEYTADKPMDWDEVAALSRSEGCTIGSHCTSHAICDTFQPVEVMRVQLFDSKRVIEEKIGKPCHYLAYPNGNVCRQAERLAEEAGYRLAFLTAYRSIHRQMSAYALPRYGVDFGHNAFLSNITANPDNLSALLW